MIIAIWCMTKKGVIGQDNILPWHEPAEMKHYVDTTLHKTIVMGRKTYEGLFKEGLPNRKMIVISRSLEPYESENLVITKDWKKLIDIYQGNPDKDLYVSGGAEIYKMFWPYCDKLIVSILKRDYEGNVYFPNVSKENFVLDTSNENSTFTIYYYNRNLNIN